MTEQKDKVLYTRAESSLVTAIKRETTKRKKASPGVKLAQADVIRSLLWEALKAQEAAR